MLLATDCVGKENHEEPGTAEGFQPVPGDQENQPVAAKGAGGVAGVGVAAETV